MPAQPLSDQPQEISRPLQIYGALVSPYVRKVALVMAEKGQPFELVLSAASHPAPGFAEASPFGKIPAIRHGDYTLSDSTAICAYLEALHPTPALLPAEPRARGRAVWFDECADTILAPPVLKVLFHRFVGLKLLKLPCSEDVALQGERDLGPVFAYLESVAPAQGWLAGDFSLGDIALASFLRSLAYGGVELAPLAHPRLAAWYDRVRARPAWAQVAQEETHIRRP